MERRGTPVSYSISGDTTHRPACGGGSAASVGRETDQWCAPDSAPAEPAKLAVRKPPQDPSQAAGRISTVPPPGVMGPSGAVIIGRRQHLSIEIAFRGIVRPRLHHPRNVGGPGGSGSAPPEPARRKHTRPRRRGETGRSSLIADALKTQVPRAIGRTSSRSGRSGVSEFRLATAARRPHQTPVTNWQPMSRGCSRIRPVQQSDASAE